MAETLNIEPLTGPVYKSPDHILAIYGAKNPYILTIWICMAFVWGLSAMPVMQSGFIMDRCSNKTSECTTVRTNCTINEGTITKEFGLESDSSIPLISTSLFYVGDVVGALIIPSISDRRGRHDVLCFSMLMFGLFGCLSALSPNPLIFLLTRFLTGIFFPGCGITNWVLAYESIPMSLRSYTALVFGLWWIVGYCIVGPLHALLGNWRWLAFTLSFPSLFFSIFYYFLLPESFHFLTLSNNVQKLKTWIKRANSAAKFFHTRELTDFDVAEYCRTTTKVNSSSAPNPHEDEAKMSISYGTCNNGRTISLNDNNSDGDSWHKISLILRSKLLRGCSELSFYTSIFAYLWTCDAFLYYGLSLFTSLLNGNRHFNYFVSGLVEIPSYIFSPMLLDLFGRRNFISFCHGIVSVSFLVVAANKVFFRCNEIVLLTNLMWMFAKFFISCSFTSLFVYASEVFPTSSRNSRMGICVAVSRSGAILVPLIRTMADISDTVPLFCFTICAGIATLVTLLIPETKDHPDLPDTDVSK